MIAQGEAKISVVFVQAFEELGSLFGQLALLASKNIKLEDTSDSFPGFIKTEKPDNAVPQLIKLEKLEESITVKKGKYSRNT